jgi:hypothetical protein
MNTQSSVLGPCAYMDVLWLGYDGLSVSYGDMVAVLLYRPSLDARIVSAYGRVPPNVRAVVMCWPSSWSPAQIRRRWSSWRAGGA